MTRNLLDALREEADAVAAVHSSFNPTRARRVVAAVRLRRGARGAAASAGAVAAVGGLAVAANYVAGHAVLRPGTGASPSVSASGPQETSVATLPSVSASWASNEWPDEGPSWSERRYGVAGVDPLSCGVSLSSLPSGVLVMTDAHVASPDEVAFVIDASSQGYGTPSPGEARGQATLFTPSDDAWVAEWTLDGDLLAYPRPNAGGTTGLSGLEEGFAPWDAFDSDAVIMALQVWGGFAVVEDGVVVGRGHMANVQAGAGTLLLGDNRPTTMRPPVDRYWILTSNSWSAVEWCPTVTPDREGRSIVAVAAATTSGTPATYAWAYLNEDG